MIHYSSNYEHGRRLVMEELQPPRTPPATTDYRKRADEKLKSGILSQRLVEDELIMHHLRTIAMLELVSC